MARMNKRLVSFLAGRRRWIHGIIALGVYALLSFMGISLWWILGIGAATGIIFGKVFCRWACPIGFIMELITGLGGDKGKFQQMYQYHKMGCPIAWISGALNRQSIFRISLDESSCTACGLCDKACYLSSLEPARFSLFRKDKERPGLAYACSKCLVCVSTCPTASLAYKPGLPLASVANR